MAIEIGSEVMVHYPPSDSQTNNPARRLEGQTFVVKTIRMPRLIKAKRQYTLYGAKSDMGMPYGS